MSRAAGTGLIRAIAAHSVKEPNLAPPLELQTTTTTTPQVSERRIIVLQLVEVSLAIQLIITPLLLLSGQPTLGVVLVLAVLRQVVVYSVLISLLLEVFSVLPTIPPQPVVVAVCSEVVPTTQLLVLSEEAIPLAHLELQGLLAQLAACLALLTTTNKRRSPFLLGTLVLASEVVLRILPLMRKGTMHLLLGVDYLETLRVLLLPSGQRRLVLDLEEQGVLSGLPAKTKVEPPLVHLEIIIKLSKISLLSVLLSVRPRLPLLRAEADCSETTSSNSNRTLVGYLAVVTINHLVLLPYLLGLRAVDYSEAVLLLLEAQLEGCLGVVKLPKLLRVGCLGVGLVPMLGVEGYLAITPTNHQARRVVGFSRTLELLHQPVVTFSGARLLAPN